MFIAQLIIIQAITFLGLVFALRKIMYSASYTETKRLQELTQENTKKAQELAAKMEEAEKQYKNRIEIAEMEANKLKAAAKEESARAKDELLDKARQEADRLLKQALNSKEKIKEELEAQLQQKCVIQSLSLIQEVLTAKNILLLHNGLTKEALEEIGKIDPVKLKANTDKGELIIADEIAKADKEEIIAVLCAKTGKNILLEEHKDKNLIAGITIKLGSLVIDGSLQGKLKEASEALKK